MKIIKRNGNEETFSKTNIINAISNANMKVPLEKRFTMDDIKNIANDIETKVKSEVHTVSTSDIQDMVERAISTNYDVLKEYIIYRYTKQLDKHNNTTDDSILSLLNNNNELLRQENSNKNPTIASTMRDYMAGEVSKDISKRYLIPSDIWKAHEDGIIHFHDTDYFAMPIHNCDLVNLEDMLNNGTVISDVMIETPKSFTTACNVATQIVAQVASSQYGGQTITLSHLAPFVEVSRKKIYKQVKEEFSDIEEDRLKEVVEKRVRREIEVGIQILNYQLITLQTTNGQAPFISVFMYLNEVENEQTKADLALVIEEVLKQRILGVKNIKGDYVAPTFPKLLYVLEEDNCKEGTKYWYLTKLAAECTAKRMVPDYISEKIMKQLKKDKKGNGYCYPCMGCRSFLTVYTDPKTKKDKFYGRFNQGVVTINLVDVACSSKKNMDMFWYILNDRLELCHRALRVRHEHLRGVRSDVAPILWQHGALARLKPGETIDNLLYNGYSTLSLGYAGLYECVKYMTGQSHTDENGGKDFALAVMKALNDACAKWKQVEKIDYSLYGTPMESTTYKFAKGLQKRFGIIKDVTDHNYITNSYHVNVREDINAFDKLKFESDFQALSPGGAISYVEVPNMQNNIPAVLEVIKYIYDTIMYAELNTKLDWCENCGYSGELQIIKDSDDKTIWKCPNCDCGEGKITGNELDDQNLLHPIRRTCGYIGAQKWNDGRTDEIKDRVLHL